MSSADDSDEFDRLLRWSVTYELVAPHCHEPFHRTQVKR